MIAVRLAPEVEAALEAGRPVVALESSVLAQGLPIPANREAGERMRSAVRAAGAVPAITAIVRGVPTVGLEGDDLERFLGRDGVTKVSARDLAPAMVRGGDGATTVAATLVLAEAAGIRVFATGGIGGVHREAPGSQPSGCVRDESADLPELARRQVVTVCAGAKSILDLGATLERLETLGVPVIGYRTSELPGFFTVRTGYSLATRAESPAELAAIARAHWALGLDGGVLVVQAPPAAQALDAAEVDAAVAGALEEARRVGVSGAAVTPFLLAAVERATGGRSLGANLALLEENARLAGRIAAAMATETRPGPTA